MSGTKRVPSVLTQYLDAVETAMRSVDLAEVGRVIDLLEDTYRRGRGVLLIGNGGSAANASHFAEDLCKGALRDEAEKRFRILSLTDNTPFITAIANDLGYDQIFTFQIRQFAQPGDVLVAISGSGNSPNILNAVRYAKKLGVQIVGFTGFDGGQLRPLADYSVHVPLRHMCQTEAVHAVIMHMIVDTLRDRIRGIA